jgi:hypothetical protein
MNIGTKVLKKQFYNISKFNLFTYFKFQYFSNPNSVLLIHPQLALFSKGKKEPDNKKTKIEKEKKDINKDYENISTEEIKTKYKTSADV